MECSVVKSVAVFHALRNLTLRSFLISSISIKFFSTLSIATYFHCTSFVKNHFTVCSSWSPLINLHFLRPFNEASAAAHRLIFGILMLLQGKHWFLTLCLYFILQSAVSSTLEWFLGTCPRTVPQVSCSLALSRSWTDRLQAPPDWSDYLETDSKRFSWKAMWKVTLVLLWNTTEKLFRAPKTEWEEKSKIFKRPGNMAVRYERDLRCWSDCWSCHWALGLMEACGESHTSPNPHPQLIQNPTRTTEKTTDQH